MQTNSLPQVAARADKPRTAWLVVYFLAVALLSARVVFGTLAITYHWLPSSPGTKTDWGVFGVYAALGGAAALAGWGIWRYRNWARILGSIVAILFMLVFGFLTAGYLSRIANILLRPPADVEGTVVVVFVLSYLGGPLLIASSIAAASLATVITLFRYDYRVAFGKTEAPQRGDRVLYRSGSFMVTEKRVYITPLEWNISGLKSAVLAEVDDKCHVSLVNKRGEQVYRIELDDPAAAEELAEAVNKAID
jgi:hypothetical protein